MGTESARRNGRWRAVCRGCAAITALLLLGAPLAAQADRVVTDLDVLTPSPVAPGATVSIVVDVTTNGSDSADNWSSTRCFWTCNNTDNSACGSILDGTTTPECDGTGDHGSDGNYTETITIAAPSEPGTWDLTCQAFGNNNCTSDSGVDGDRTELQVLEVQPPPPNPDLDPSCGLDVTFILDASTSICQVNAEDDVRGGFDAFINALKNTGSRVAVVQFGTESQVDFNLTVDPLSDVPAPGNVQDYIGPTGRNYINDEYPLCGGGVNYTNWEGALTDAVGLNNFLDWEAMTMPNPGFVPLVIFFTDGDPTADEDGIIGTSASDIAAALASAIPQADTLKGQGSHILALGVGSVNTANLVAISGPEICDNTCIGGGGFDIRTTDVVIPANFNALAEAISEIAFALCKPSVTITKVFDTGVGEIVFEGWEFAGRPAVDPPADDFLWVEPVDPSGDDCGSDDSGRTATTDSTGTATFQWLPVDTDNCPTDPIPVGDSPSIDICEQKAPFVTFESLSCTRRTRVAVPNEFEPGDQIGDIKEQTCTASDAGDCSWFPTNPEDIDDCNVGTPDLPFSPGGVTIELGPNDIVTCTVTNMNSSTLAVVSGIEAYSARSGETVVEWRTSSEVGTVGFALQRHDETSGAYVTVREVPASGALQGGRYRVVDSEAYSGDQLSYRLVETEADGEQHLYGPWDVTVDGESSFLSRPLGDEPRRGRRWLGSIKQTLEDGYSVVANTEAGAADRQGYRRARGAQLAAPASQAGTAGGRSPSVSDDSRGGQAFRSLMEGFRGLRNRNGRGGGAGNGAGGTGAGSGAGGSLGGLMPVISGSSTADTLGVAKARITEAGLYHVSGASIATALGITTDEANQRVVAGQVSIENQGQPVAYAPASQGGLYFYAEAIDSVYASENVYWLRDAGGRQMAVVADAAPTPVETAQSFMAVEHFEEDHTPIIGFISEPGEDYLAWQYFYPPQTRSVSLDVPGVASTAGAVVEIHLYGATSDTHHAEASLNGVPIGGGTWRGTNPHTLVLDATSLVDGLNTLEISGVVDAGVGFTQFALDSVDVHYLRRYEADGGALLARGGGNTVVTVSGFAQSAIAVFDVSAPRSPKLVTGTTVDGASGQFRVSFVPAAPGAEYLVIEQGAAAQATLVADTPSSLRSAANGADYVALVTDDLRAATQELVDHRNQDGLTATTVSLEDVYDEYNYGIASPLAVRDFVADAATRWGLPLRYLTIIGDGSYDFTNALGTNDSVVPSMLVSTPDGVFASDSSFGIVDRSGIPRVAVGRIPVVASAELQAYISKLKAVEAEPAGTWTSRVAVVSDDADGAGDFPQDAGDVAGMISAAGYVTEQFSLSEMSVSDAHTQLLGAINDPGAGVAAVAYMGHGGVDRLAAEGIVVSGDEAAMTNGARLPILAALSCVAARFDIPGYDSLGERLVLSASGGMSAAWGPSGLSRHAPAALLGKGFAEAAFGAQPSERLGDAVLRAHQYLQDNGTQNPYYVGNFYIHKLYNTLGDSAQRLR